VSNSQKSDKADDGVSRDTLNDWQRKDAARKSGEAKQHPEANPKDAGNRGNVAVATDLKVRPRWSSFSPQGEGSQERATPWCICCLAAKRL
jgi:hypothetical protein